MVGWLFQPSLRSGLPKLRPGVPFSTTTQLTPRGPSSPVRTIVTYRSDTPPPEMNALEPFSRYCALLDGSARVRSAAASEPEPGSVRQ